MMTVFVALSLIQIVLLLWLIHETKKPFSRGVSDLPTQTNSYGMVFKKKKIKPTVIDDEKAWALEKKNKTGLEV